MSAVKNERRVSNRNKSERRVSSIRRKRAKRSVKQAKRNPYVFRTDGPPGGPGDDNGATGNN